MQFIQGSPATTHAKSVISWDDRSIIVDEDHARNHIKRFFPGWFFKRSRLPVIYDELDKKMAEGVRGQPVSCKPGCSACCSQWVGVHYIEAEECVKEAKRVGFKIDEQRLERLANLSQKDGMGRKLYWEQQEPCIFLDKQGKCGVYKARPVACRAVLVKSDPKECGKIDGKVIKYNSYADVHNTYKKVRGESVALARTPCVGNLPVMVRQVLQGKSPGALGKRWGVFGVDG